ncbi:ejaculatory bulb-specific protein 3-like [Topomyia yanbarensis]|uniref:ejaculatory bulb-specific protein 3-like n=1 Tax=Topomyia yanbarensis TaxID=2498891 RepID=UPI00273BE9E7|nr:ejaculatory bulb-specific protein 3-like [Topomyia yanbarensis]
MKLVVLCVIIAFAVAQEETGTYTNRFDNIDIEEVLMSDRLYRGYYNCLLDMGPCTPEGSELKRYLPEALENGCARCTEKQREFGIKAINYLIENRPEDWAILKAKFDPDNKIIEKYREQAVSAGINLTQ